MDTEHDMAVAMATEIGKQVPVKQVYEDAASPAARQVGATIEDVVKCIRLVGFPIQWLAVQQDRYRDFIERAARSVPVDQRILPTPELLGPILEGIRYKVHDDTISDAFRRLLSRAMDSSRADEAHPSFIGFISQLSPYEVFALNELQDGDIELEGEMRHGVVTYIGPCAYRLGGLDDHAKILVALNNLERLGLAKIYSLPLELERSVQLAAQIEDLVARDGPRAIGRIFVSQTPIGRAFVHACLCDP